MLQRNAYFNYPDIDPIHDKVLGRLLSAKSAEKTGDLPDALASVESTFDVDGFNGTSPHYAFCLEHRDRLQALLRDKIR